MMLQLYVVNLVISEFWKSQLELLILVLVVDQFNFKMWLVKAMKAIFLCAHFQETHRVVYITKMQECFVQVLYVTTTAIKNQ